MNKKEFIEKHLEIWNCAEGNSMPYTEFIADLDNLLTSSIGEYLQEELNNSDVGSLEYKIIEKMLEEL